MRSPWEADRHRCHVDESQPLLTELQVSWRHPLDIVWTDKLTVVFMEGKPALLTVFRVCHDQVILINPNTVLSVWRKQIVNFEPSINTTLKVCLTGRLCGTFKKARGGSVRSPRSLRQQRTPNSYRCRA